MTAIVFLCSRLNKDLGPLQKIMERISFANKILKTSDVFQTQDKAGIVSRPFLSCTISVETDMDPQHFLQFLIEARGQINDELNQVPGSQDKIVDCDLIDFQGEVFLSPQLTLPYPEAHQKAFVIIPLSEMLPKWQHPVLKKTAAELAREAYWPSWGSFFAGGKTLLDF